MNLQDVEMAVCGLMLREPAYVAEAVSRGLGPSHFTQPIHGQIFAACVATWKAGEPSDLVTIARKVGREHLDQVSRLRLNAPHTPNVAPYVTALIDTARASELHARLTDIGRVVSLRSPMDSLDPVVASLGELLSFGRESTAVLQTSFIGEAVDRSLHSLEERILSAKDGKPPGIPSGFPSVDRTTYGFQPGFVYVLGARTGVGKTTMATTMAVNAARAGHKVSFVTVEMSDADIADKMLSRISKVPMSRLLSGTLKSDELDRVADGARVLQALPILITEVQKPTFDRLSLEIMRLVRVEKVGLVIVDYLQLFETGDARTNRKPFEEAKLVSARLKGLARSLKVPILVLSQLNRQAAENAEPELIHIADTDQVARDADCVMFLFVESHRYYLSIAKMRRGKKVRIPLSAVLETSLFEEAPRDGTR